MNRTSARYMKGTYVLDLATGREGVLMGYEIPGCPERQGKQSTQVRAFLRPLSGGVEWDTDPTKVKPL